MKSWPSVRKIPEFVDSSYKFVAENEVITQKTAQKDDGVIGVLFRNMHTIKGNARTYGLLHMTNVVHETEQTYHELRQNPEMVWDSEMLGQQLAQVKNLVDEYAKVNSHTLGRKGPGAGAALKSSCWLTKNRWRSRYNWSIRWMPPTSPPCAQRCPKLARR
ncbi:MAG: Hpt domain-containing protein [Burkholderiales bacterium]|nr:Hpt domain-containing protein [Burkholderiales bacterium]